MASNEMIKPLSERACSFFLNYDVTAAAAFLKTLRRCPVMEQIETLKKNLELFRKPDATKEVGEEDEDKEYDDEVDEAEEDEKGGGQEIPKLMVDDTKPATDRQRQVPNEGERECKKSRLASGFGCQGEA
ncbi:hypothetical protein C2845_PM11G12710 [Panicum miliaceum]|uniref:Uncharacterized protein n=1 Tax=Panicum miliaceum TaxID=4540 RepID=A0A3L6RQP0_PANMI|nr:hypothetical protein C2845_PM11G12710 [Panicum miliaceum]